MDIQAIDSFRQTKYTGENRCEPCTVLNLLLAGLFSFIVARKSRRGAKVAFAIALTLIYVRGYFIPGTPVLTKRYLPSSVLRWFGKESTPQARDGFNPKESAKQYLTENNNNDAHDTPSEKKIDPHRYLASAGILEPCEDVDDLCLVNEFQSDWNEQMKQVANEDISAGDLISALGIKDESFNYEITEFDDASVLSSDNGVIGKWPSRDSLIADIGAADILNEWSSNWDALDPNSKGAVLNSLRLFLNECPTSQGGVSMKKETVESCCSSQDVVVVVCDETDARLFEHRIDEIEALSS